MGSRPGRFLAPGRPCLRRSRWRRIQDLLRQFGQLPRGELEVLEMFAPALGAQALEVMLQDFGGGQNDAERGPKFMSIERDEIPLDHGGHDSPGGFSIKAISCYLLPKAHSAQKAAMLVK